VCYNDPTLYGKVAHTPFEQQAAITLQTNYHGADLA
jgi:carbonyl reductase 1